MLYWRAKSCSWSNEDTWWRIREPGCDDWSHQLIRNMGNGLWARALVFLSSCLPVVWIPFCSRWSFSCWTVETSSVLTQMPSCKTARKQSAKITCSKNRRNHQSTMNLVWKKVWEWMSVASIVNMEMQEDAAQGKLSLLAPRSKHQICVSYRDTTQARSTWKWVLSARLGPDQAGEW